MQITFVLIFTHSSFQLFTHSTKTPGEKYYSNHLQYGNKHEKQSFKSSKSDMYYKGKTNKKPKRKWHCNILGVKRAGEGVGGTKWKGSERGWRGDRGT